MHLKTIIKKDNKIFIEHFVIIDAIDGSDTYYEELTIKNCIKYFPEIIHFIIRQIDLKLDLSGKSGLVDL